MRHVTVVPVIEEWSLEPPTSTAPVLAILAGALAGVTLALRRPALQNTTLLPAWWWAIAATAAWSAAEAAAALAGPKSAGWVAPLRLAAVALGFCPILAVLGAKR